MIIIRGEFVSIELQICLFNKRYLAYFAEYEKIRQRRGGYQALQEVFHDPALAFSLEIREVLPRAARVREYIVRYDAS
jgi:hypothetical protein